MDHESRRQWELKHPGTDILKYDDLSKFLTTRCRALEAARASKQKSNKWIDFGQAHSCRKAEPFIVCHSNQKMPPCKQAHGLYACDEFKKTVDNIRKFVKDEELCINCLRLCHIAKHCSSMKNVSHVTNLRGQCS